MTSKKLDFTMLFPISAYIIGPILSFLSLPIITYSINPANYGTYNYYISLISYVVLLSFFPSLNSTVLRFLNKDFDTYINDRNTLLAGCFISLCLYLIFCIILFNFINDMLFIYLCICYLAIHFFTLYKSFLNINGQKISFSTVLLAVTLSQYSVIFFLYFTSNISTYHLLLGNLVSSILILVFVFVPKIKKFSIFQKIEKQSAMKISKFSMLSMVIALSGILLATSDRILIKHLLENGDYFLGIYSVHYQLFSYFIDILVGIFFIYIPHYLYVKYEKNGLQSYLLGLRYVLDWFIVLATFFVIVVMLSHDALSHIMFDSFYLQQSKLSLYIIVGQYYFGIYLALANYFTVVNKKLNLTLLLLFFGIVNLSLNIVFIPVYGFIVAAITTLLCYFSLFISVFIITKSKTGYNLISKFNWILLSLPMFLLLLLNEQKIYTSNFSAFQELFFNTLVVTIVYVTFNFKRMKIIFEAAKNDV